jgi:environmental stress-induced protein Ves
MTGRVVNPDRYRRMPWKNGGGETIEIAIFPPGSDLDNFGWRISTAAVGSDGPFSIFQGIDRTLCVLSGSGISLAVDNGEVLTLDQDSTPFSFPADAPANARLLDGPITDLNVMTRRAEWRHEVRRHRIRAGDILTVDAAATWTIVFCQRGAVALTGDPNVSLIAGGDTLIIEGDTGAYGLCATEPATAFAISISPAHTQSPLLSGFPHVG